PGGNGIALILAPTAASRACSASARSCDSCAAAAARSAAAMLCSACAISALARMISSRASVAAAAGLPDDLGPAPEPAPPAMMSLMTAASPPRSLVETVIARYVLHVMRGADEVASDRDRSFAVRRVMFDFPGQADPRSAN